MDKPITLHLVGGNLNSTTLIIAVLCPPVPTCTQLMMQILGIFHIAVHSVMSLLVHKCNDNLHVWLPSPTGISYMSHWTKCTGLVCHTWMISHLESVQTALTQCLLKRAQALCDIIFFSFAYTNFLALDTWSSLWALWEQERRRWREREREKERESFENVEQLIWPPIVPCSYKLCTSTLSDLQERAPRLMMPMTIFTSVTHSC